MLSDTRKPRKLSVFEALVRETGLEDRPLNQLGKSIYNLVLFVYRKIQFWSILINLVKHSTISIVVSYAA